MSVVNVKCFSNTKMLVSSATVIAFIGVDATE